MMKSLDNVTSWKWLLVIVTIFVLPAGPCLGFSEIEEPVADSSRELTSLSFDELLQVQVVTSSRTTAIEYSSAPATMFVVTAEQIRNRNYQSLLEVLSDLPNLKVDYANDPRWMSDFSIRGIWGMDKFIILIDGVRVSSPTNDTVPIMENYPVHFAKRIEVVYGPASALYGADAFSGVVNIISKTADDIEDSGEVSLGGGTYGAYLGNMSLGLKLADDVSLTIAGQYLYDEQPDLADFYADDFAGRDEALRSGTFDTIFGPMTPLAPVDPDAESPLEAWGLYAALTVKGFKLSYFGNYARHPSSIANKPNNNIYNKDVFFKRSISVVSGVYSADIGSLTSRSFISGSWHRLDPSSKWRNVFTNMEPAYQYNYGRMIKAEQLLTWAATDSFQVTGGLTYEKFLSIPDGHDLAFPVASRHSLEGVIVNSDIYANNSDGIPARFFELRYSNVGGLVEAYYRPSQSLSINLGARYDDNSRFGSSTNPRLGVVWSPSERLSARVTYGTAFLAPSPYNAFAEFGSFVSFDDGRTFQSFFMRLSNPDLKPQKNRTAELGLRFRAMPNLNLSATAFYSDLRGLFTQVSDADFGDRYGGLYPVEGHEWPIDYIETVVNLGKQRNYGGTIQIDFQRRLGEQGRGSLWAALSYVDGKVDPDGDGPLGETEIGGVSPLSFKAGADIILDRLTISPRLILLGRQRTHPLQSAAFRSDDPHRRQTIDGYALLNLDLQYKLMQRLRIYIKARNLLNERYRTVNLGAAPEGLEAGSAAVEFEDGAPQNPFRVIGGLQISF